MAGLLNRGSIALRTLLTFATPLLLVILALGYHFTSANMVNARKTMNERGAFMAKQLAALSEFGAYSQDIVELRNNADSILQEPGVVRVTIDNIHGEVLVSATKEGLTLERNGLVVFEAPILRTGINVTDYASEMDEHATSTSSVSIGLVSVFLSDTDVVANQKRILLSGIFITACGLLISLLLALFVSRSISNPILRLMRTVSKLTSGDLETRAQVGSPGEIGELEQGINQMAGTLQDAHEELVNEVEEATTALKVTVTKLERRNVELKQAKAEAERAGTAKSEFLASMSHEIRTPLSAVIGYSQLLEKMDQTEEQQEYTRTITQAASQLLVIIDDILGFTRLEWSKPRLEMSLIRLHERFENIISIQSAAAHEKQLELVLLIHSDVPAQIISDTNRIGQVLTNLVANAIKFTGQGHIVIEVSLKESGNEEDIIEVSVTDTGIGMSSDEAGRIFQPFTQADASTSKKYGGTGLGLSISKKLIELIDGNIGVTSEPGKGSRFWFTIPSARLGTTSTQLEQPLQETRVLVYEKNTFSRRALRNRFFSWGASVFNTGQWEEMLDMLDAARHADNPYELLVLGLSVHEYGSRQIAEILEDIRRLNDIPVLVLVGSEANSLQTGDSDISHVRIISKPPRSERMLRIVQALLAKPGESHSSRYVTRTDHVGTSDGELAGLQVLVAEDNEFNQGLIRHLLEELGVSVTIAANGEQACSCASDTQFDLILMDIHMPVVGGIEASRTIRAGKNRNTPIIALSADVFACEDQLDGGIMQACITKPVSKHKLAEILREWTTPVPDSKEAANRNGTGVENSLPTEMEQRLYAELAAQLASLRTACQTADQTGIRDHLHQLKGMTDYFQLAEFRTGCDALHQAAAAGNQVAMIAALDRLDSILAGGSG